MDKAIKEEWVEWLRSGEFEQGRVTLRSGDNKFCCLGVLCEILDVPVEQSTFGDFLYMGYGASLPPSVKSKAGLREYECLQLACWNDHGKSFEDIADIIEQWL